MRTGRRLAAWLTRSRRDDELREEIENHITERCNRLVDDGMDPREAAYEARRQFGNPVAVREETRDMRSFRWLDTLAQDTRFGTRVLLRTPLFSGVAVLSLALGIGAAVAVFNVADAVLFRQLPVRDPGALRSFRVDIRFGANSKVVNGVPAPSVAAIQRGSDFADFIGFRLSDDVALGLDGAAATRMSRVEFVTGNYFDVLGVGAAAGRLLSPADDAAAPVPVVVTEKLWSTVGAGDAPGRLISLNGTPAVVVGVARRFHGLSAERPADVFAPLRAGALVDPTQTNFVVQLVARLRSGVAAAEAEQKLGNLYKVAMPGGVAGAQLQVELRDASRGVSGAREALTRPLWLGLALVGLLVLVACANTSGLLLSRFMARQGEFGIRIAIGAGRLRLARQLAVEALLVAFAAALVGLTLGWTLAPLLMRIVPETGSPVAFELRFDRRLMFFTAALTVLCAIGAASASMLRLWRGDSSAFLSSESRTVVTGSRRVTRALIAAQVACSLLLVVGAVSMSRTLVNLRGVPLGFDLDRMFVVTANAAGLVAPDAMSAYHTALHDRIAAVPGVERATMAQIGVLTSSATVGTITVAGFTPSSDDDRIARMFFVGPDYFETIGMRVLAGRSLNAQDAGPRTTTAVVNERFAKFYFGSATAALDQVVNTDVRIVGVVTDAHYNTPRDEPGRAMFVSHRPVQRSAMAHIVRAAGDPAATMRAVGEAVASHDARLRPRLAMASELMAAALARERFVAAIASVLSGLALILACAGLYAAVAYSVTQRHGELAVRVALGASRADVMRLVLRDPLFTTTVGIAAGIPGTYLLMRSTRSLLFGVSPFDLPTVAVCGVALLSCAVLAALWPARRALAIDPVAALRNG